MNITLPIKPYRVADLLCCAIEGGSSWINIIGYKDPSTPIDLETYEGKFDAIYKHIHYPLSVDGSITIKDDYDDAKPYYILDLAKVNSGLTVFATKYPRHFGNWLCEKEDAITGDIFIQCCLFGEVVYD